MFEASLAFRFAIFKNALCLFLTIWEVTQPTSQHFRIAIARTVGWAHEASDFLIGLGVAICMPVDHETIYTAPPSLGAPGFHGVPQGSPRFPGARVSSTATQDHPNTRAGG